MNDEIAKTDSNRVTVIIVGHSLRSRTQIPAFFFSFFSSSKLLIDKKKLIKRQWTVVDTTS